MSGGEHGARPGASPGGRSGGFWGVAGAVTAGPSALARVCPLGVTTPQRGGWGWVSEQQVGRSEHTGPADFKWAAQICLTLPSTSSRILTLHSSVCVCILCLSLLCRPLVILQNFSTCKADYLFYAAIAKVYESLEKWRLQRRKGSLTRSRYDLNKKKRHDCW